MKFRDLITVLICLVAASNANAQTINWKTIQTENRHMLNINLGVEYGLIYGIGYGYHIKSDFPIILNLEYSFPSGNNLTDDFKTKIGGKILLYQIRNFHFSANIQGVFRKYENEFVRIVNFGSDFSGMVGYYNTKWFVSGEFGFDKAIVTNFKHSDLYEEYFPNVSNGWYQPATGGNFYYGVQTGISIKNCDVYLKGGSLIAQDFKTKPSFPYYTQLGFNIKFMGKN